MKISNSKKQLAKIIHENGGGRDWVNFAAQDKDGEVFGFGEKPVLGASRAVWAPAGHTGILCTSPTIRGWHQTILSRDEYFHLYPVAEPVKVVVENKTTCHLTVADKPTIEQLAADYRNVKDYADRKQQAADAAKADAEAKLAELVAAGKAIWLALSVSSPEPELVITDWRDLKVGDEIECIESNINRYKYNGMVGRLHSIDESDASTPYLVDFCGDVKIWCHKVKFIRRPAKGADNA